MSFTIAFSKASFRTLLSSSNLVTSSICYNHTERG
uniref:Uncharacterized protein n=1 Tax=Siphoviridae sp. ctiam3 TaxID=2825624 RepID=A0A8S5P6D3_9CAUD|nr:MAG TPA: hypothetical protein [Siphoviridae sp. ctiam3]DAS91705.1 MAG TPA: hypothetical protein [Caudoviricetes sp.]